MELDCECSASQPVEAGETIANTNSDKPVVGVDDIKLKDYKNNRNERIDESIETTGKAAEITEEPVKSASASAKGYGLKKWRRIRREEVCNDGDNSAGGSKLIMKRGLSVSHNDSAKSVHFQGEISQKSDDTVSFPNEFVSNLGMNCNSLASYGHAFLAGADSENSEEDSSSKSSTAASAPPNKNNLVNINRRNIGVSSVQKKASQPRIAVIESSKKHRGERVKIEKENSYSSMESDSRSSNFVFMQGTRCLKSQNGTRASDEGMDGEGKASYNEGNSGEYEDVLQEGLSAESSWDGKEGKNENQGTPTNYDPVVESIFKLQAAKEALEREVEKLKEIAKEDILVNFSCQDGTEASNFTSIGLHQGPSIAQTLQFSTDLETELEVLYRQKIEAEVEVLLSKAAAVDQITLLEEQKALASEQAKIANKLGSAQEKAVMLKDEAEKVETYCENMVATAYDSLRLQKHVYKHAFCLFSQLILLVIFVGLFLFRLSILHGDDEVVPT
ncbi:unnamed protein product [Cuscuta epithymum]|uniref:WPP domain-interacting protein 2 n=1 Tax=Cuscuta epithymum TaxID=186058 RepID=A0AAV0G6Z9_9ASTE|nr:unnamed protein product [Cuscuta epithymum]CAH9143534.1 unnamed protein product [Cuscuta epithymum]